MYLQLSSSNTESALLILEECFADNCQLASEYLDAITDVKRTSDKSTSDIIDVYIELRNCLIRLATLGDDTSHRGAMVAELSCGKWLARFPAFLRSALKVVR